MADLDVSDVLLDPDFADRLTVTRNVQTVDQHGRASVSEEETSILGVVTADKARERAMAAAGVFIKGSILVHTTFQLTDGSAPDTDSDVVTWRSKQYTVVQVSDYSHFGAGFVSASCDIKTLSG
ncbi:hypothetical protein ACQUFY_08500 [Robbsia andropogonis]|uniref:hypothetical protein n=1 Tax=Robbsia andropogonis TaxID=28092 RepID=UPI003D25091A